MKCACDDEKCQSRIEWDVSGRTLRATHSYNGEERVGVKGEVLLYYDANTLVELIKEARKALVELASGES